MLSNRVRPKPGLARAVAKYEAKLARAQNPTQHQYAAGMLRMARAALAESEGDVPVAASDPAGIVTLHRDEYDVR